MSWAVRESFSKDVLLCVSVHVQCVSLFVQRVQEQVQLSVCVRTDVINEAHFHG